MIETYEFASEDEDDQNVVENIDEQDEASAFRYSISAYGADFPVDAIVKRMSNGDIAVPTFGNDDEFDDIRGFQRRYIWTKAQKDRFIESLLLGLPVPGIFLVESPDGRLLVLDGQQRLRTLETFCHRNPGGRVFVLNKVDHRFHGKTYDTLDLLDRRRFDNSIIHATIVRQDEPSDDQSSIYMIFERLNTGGTSLQPQEIRVALHGGSFVTFLSELNDLPQWRDIYGAKSIRLKDQELILRFFALLYRVREYQRPMKEFMNQYLSRNKNISQESQIDMRIIFESTITTICQAFDPKPFRFPRAINVAIMDAVLVGIATRIQEKGPINDSIALKTAYETLLENESFREAAESATTNENNVKLRIDHAVTMMKDVD